MLFVQATPKSELKRRIQEEVDVSGIQIEVIERAGTKEKRIIQRNNSFASAVTIRVLFALQQGKETAENQE